jgi:flagellar motor component MotA
MSKTKTIAVVLITAILGSLTFFLTAPTVKALKNKRQSKTSVDSGIDSKEDLFI